MGLGKRVESPNIVMDRYVGRRAGSRFNLCNAGLVAVVTSM